MTRARHGPGFFGKVATHGDFVSRRLPAGALMAWDTWLQAALRCSRGQLGDSWLDAYLAAPMWRFMLAPGVCGTAAWTGVLMPSVDRVGRHFPLTVAAALPAAVALHDSWYDAVEALALSALAPGFVLDDFDAALLALDPPTFRPAPVLPGQSMWWRGDAQAMLCPGLPPPQAFAGMLAGGRQDLTCSPPVPP